MSIVDNYASIAADAKRIANERYARGGEIKDDSKPPCDPNVEMRNKFYATYGLDPDKVWAGGLCG